MKTFTKLYAFTFLFASLMLLAEDPPAPITMKGGPGGGGGGVTPGAPSSPIDMYVYILAIAAIVMIVYFAKKYKTQKI